jgi:23S rRNA (cytosine1962-C5)-methyltransferase
MTAPDLASPDLAILVARDWEDYALLDSGDGRKLERAGPYRFIRPEPQALWRPRADEAVWAGADAVFDPSGADEDSGRWRFARPLPEHWAMSWQALRFRARATPFRHLAFFPEHSVHWRYAAQALAARAPDAPQAEVLNLFAYSGLASLVCARAGARVTHVDASKRAIAFARENQAEAQMEAAPIRWIVDDAAAFVAREARRGRRYDGIILDPPKFGRGPKGETWRLETDLAALLAGCGDVLAPDGFLIATVYAVRLSALALALAATDAVPGRTWEVGEMALPHANDERLLPTAIFARTRGA